MLLLWWVCVCTCQSAKNKPFAEKLITAWQWLADKRNGSAQMQSCSKHYEFSFNAKKFLINAEDIHQSVFIFFVLRDIWSAPILLRRISSINSLKFLKTSFHPRARFFLKGEKYLKLLWGGNTEIQRYTRCTVLSGQTGKHQNHSLYIVCHHWMLKIKMCKYYDGKS